MAEYATLHGLKELGDALRGLPVQFASKNGGPMRKALFMAAKPMRDDAIARAPEETGNLKSNIYLYRDRNPAAAGATERYIIGVRTKNKKYGRSRMNVRLGRVGKNYRTRGDAFYWWFVEFGTESSGPGGKGPGQKAQPFLRPAFESGKFGFTERFAAEFRKGVDNAVKRARAAAHA